jgi:hypothetical protein
VASQLIPSLIVDPFATIRKDRELPVPGQLLCHVGELVESSTIVARASLAGDLLVLKVAEKLGIEPFEVIRGLKVAVNDQIYENQLLCEHSGIFGLFKSRYHAPAAGVVEFVSEATGHVGIRLAAKLLEIKAHLAGKVVATRAKRAVSIESNAVLVQGILGVGGERVGLLQLLHFNKETAVTASDLPEDLSGKVIVAPTWADGEALRVAADRGAQGFILGSLDDSALSHYLGYDIGIALTGNEDISMSVILTEGFGHLRMAARTMAIFAELAGCRVALDGTTQVRAGAVRPEIIVFPEKDRLFSFREESKSSQFSIGTRVRIIRDPYFGEIATILSIPDKPQRIETGAETRVLQVCFADGRQAIVPRANIELV